MNLPENYVVICETQEETKEVINFIETRYKTWQFWRFITVSNNEWNIYSVKNNTQMWFKIRNILDYKTFTFKEWKEMKEKPFEYSKQVTYDMITTHPYFKTLSSQELLEIIGNGTLELYDKLEGKWAKDKAEILFNKFNNTTIQKITISITELLEIHKIACSFWKSKIANYLIRVDSDQNVTFNQSEIDEMFKAATTEQKPVLIKIFGEQNLIKWDRIKTGSKVMIKFTNAICSGNCDYTKSVDVVFYRTKQLITGSNIFKPEGASNNYCTFHQDGEFILFSADNNTNYITKVIEY